VHRMQYVIGTLLSPTSAFLNNRLGTLSGSHQVFYSRDNWGSGMCLQYVLLRCQYCGTLSHFGHGFWWSAMAKIDR
jgi:hypothetical protein